jgi:hypothetical protein
MPDLRFTIEGIQIAQHAAVPTLCFKLRVENSRKDEQIHSILLRCQIQIEAPRRRYSSDEKDRLYELFDRPERWGKTLRPLLWTQTTAVVPGFKETILTDLLVPCTFDFNVAGTKYFHAISEGEASLTLLFSGTVFHANDSGQLQVAQLPWDRETPCRFSVNLWRELMQTYYPHGVWLCLRHDVFNQVNEFKVRSGLSSFEAALEKMVAASSSANSLLDEPEIAGKAREAVGP